MIGQDITDRVDAELARWQAPLVDLSHGIHAHPELNFNENFAHDALCELFERAGFHVERHAYGLATAFVARRGQGEGPNVAILCEYDALPGVGHACGHNVIAAIGAGAGIAAAQLVEDCDGRLVVLGTPGEEGGGGKVDLLNAGAFDDVDIALMVHPADRDLTHMDAIAVAQLMVTYHGRASHAAAAPQKGKNALDAAVLGYMNVAALRQHIDDNERVHGIFTKAGEAANVVPETTQAHWFVRSVTLATLQPLVDRVKACLIAGATAAGCTIEIEAANHTYADMVNNPVLVGEYVRQSARHGRDVTVPDAANRVVGSTDMGNVSHRVPSIHPMIQVAPNGTAIHTQAFAELANAKEADRAIIEGASAIACIAARCWTDHEFVTSARDAFDQAIHSNNGPDI